MCSFDDNNPLISVLKWNGRAAWQHDIGVQILADVTATRVDETWLEQYFLATVVAHDDATLANES